jgi:hypothetical protein
VGERPSGCVLLYILTTDQDGREKHQKAVRRTLGSISLVQNQGSSRLCEVADGCLLLYVFAAVLGSQCVPCKSLKPRVTEKKRLHKAGYYPPKDASNSE